MQFQQISENLAFYVREAMRYLEHEMDEGRHVRRVLTEHMIDDVHFQVRILFEQVMADVLPITRWAAYRHFTSGTKWHHVYRDKGKATISYASVAHGWSLSISAEAGYLLEVDGEDILVSTPFGEPQEEQRASPEDNA